MDVSTSLTLLLVLPVLWFSKINGQLLTLDRNEKDTIHSISCFSTKRATGGYTVCTCKPQYATVLSKDRENWDCRSPKEVGCQHYLGKTKKVYLITKANITEELFPRIKGNESSMQEIKIYIWNYRLDHVLDDGHWDEVTTAASRFFTLDQGGNVSLSTFNLDLNKWRGQAIKIKVDDNTCVLAKMPGKIDYPLDVKKFKDLLNTTVHSTTPRPKTTIPVKTTTITTRTRTTSATPSTTPKRGKQGGNPDDSKAETIYIVVGVLIVVAFIVTVFTFIFRRRRSATLAKVEEDSENKLKDICVENMHHDIHRDISHLVLSDACNGITIDRVESFKGTEDEADGSSSDNNSACANPDETTNVMDAYSGVMDNSSSEDEPSEEINVCENDSPDLVAGDNVTPCETEPSKTDAEDPNEYV